MAKKYSVGLVGEASYQAAIADLKPGEHIDLVPEPSNPHDPRAIAARDGEGRPIGYLPRDHWLTEALLDQAKSCTTIVERIEGGDDGRPSLGVVLQVELASTLKSAKDPIPAHTRVMLKDVRPKPIDEDRAVSSNKKIGKGCGCALIGLIGLFIVVGVFGEGTKDEEASQAAPAAASATEEAAVIAWYDGIMDAAAPCDVASKRMGEITIAISEGNASMFDGYGAAQRTQAACRESSMAVGGVSIPAAFEGELEEQAEEARDTCQLAYAARRQSAEAAMEVFDGDMRPSKMSTMTELAQQGSNGIMACVAQAMQVVDAAGVDIARLQAQ